MMNNDIWNEIELRIRSIVREECEAVVDRLIKEHETRLSELKDRPHNEPTKKPVLNNEEAAEFLRVSPMTLGRYRKDGTIGFYRIGSRVVFSVEEHLIPFLQRCERGEVFLRKR